MQAQLFDGTGQEPTRQVVVKSQLEEILRQAGDAILAAPCCPACGRQLRVRAELEKAPGPSRAETLRIELVYVPKRYEEAAILTETCPTCKGVGRDIVADTCPNCDGIGRVPKLGSERLRMLWRMRHRIRRLYENEMLSTSEIARKLTGNGIACQQQTVWAFLTSKLGMKLRTSGEGHRVYAEQHPRNAARVEAERG